MSFNGNMGSSSESFVMRNHHASLDGNERSLVTFHIFSKLLIHATSKLIEIALSYHISSRDLHLNDWMNGLSGDYHLIVGRSMVFRCMLFHFSFFFMDVDCAVIWLWI